MGVPLWGLKTGGSIISYNLHFMDEGAGSQRGEVTCPRSQSGIERLEPGPTQILSLASSHCTSCLPSKLLTIVVRIRMFPSLGNPECSLSRSKVCTNPLTSRNEAQLLSLISCAGLESSPQLQLRGERQTCPTPILVDSRDSQWWRVCAQKSGPGW